MIGDLPTPLPDGVLNRSELSLLDKMISHRIRGHKELGVIWTTAKHTVALGHVIAGICAGLERGKDVKLVGWYSESADTIDNLHATTLAGDIAQSTIDYKNGTIKVLFGPGGTWDSSTCPEKFTLTGPASKATEAEILGDLDGFILGSVIMRYPAKTKLSQILQEYYSTGLAFDTNLKDSNRVLQYKSRVMDKDLEVQSARIGHAFLKKFSTSGGLLLAADIPALVRESMVQFYKNKHFKVCSPDTEDYSINHFIKLVKKIENKTSANLEQCTNYVRSLVKELSNDFFNDILGPSQPIP